MKRHQFNYRLAVLPLLLSAAGSVTFTHASMLSPSFSHAFVDQYNELCGMDDDDEGCAEISAYDPNSGYVFTTDATNNTLRVLTLGMDFSLQDQGTLSLAAYGAAPNSVAVSANGILAVAMEAAVKQDPGTLALFDAQSLEPLAQVTTGALPDMLTFTPDGRYAVVANEGEPDSDYINDPEGSVSIIDMQTFEARTADFSAFSSVADPSIRIFGPGATVAQDLEPEYVVVSDDSSTAWVVLQENNAIAEVDIETASVSALWGLGFKDHSQSQNAFDASNRDDNASCPHLTDDGQCINIQSWTTLGMYQPDAMDSFTVGGQTYLITANEGDARDYDGYSEEIRVGDDEVVLDPEAFPDAAFLQQSENLGRLKASTANADIDSDGDIDIIYSYGARSFSIWDTNGHQVFDSGSEFEQRLKTLQQNGLDVWTDSRSDDKGPEPESVVVGALGEHLFAFIGLERISGIFVYLIDDPMMPEYIDYIDLKKTGNIAPEGLVFVPGADAENGALVVTSEVSNTTTVYRVSVRGNSVMPEPSQQPSVEGNIISWMSDNYYQVQDAETFDSLCEGRDIDRCEVESGSYTVIDHDTGQRYESVPVSTTPEPVVDGLRIYWYSNDYVQVQTADTYTSLCEGNNIRFCDVAPGLYNVINHTTGQRFELIEVGL